MIPPPRQGGGGTRAPALTYAVRVVVHVFVPGRGMSSQQAHPPSTRTRDSGKGRRLIDCLGTFTRLTRIEHFKESVSSFASSVGYSWDVRSHLLSTRSLLTSSETRLSISLTHVFTLRDDPLSMTPKTAVISCALFRLSMCAGTLN